MQSRLFILLLICLVSCRSGQDKQSDSVPSPGVVKDNLIEINRNLLRQEMLRIQEYIDSTKLDMLKTGTGLFIDLVRDRDGDIAQAGKHLIFTYKIRSLKGDLLYSSEELGKREFVVDKTDVESGWNEAAKLMSLADSAVLILPPHLAFGNLGDGNRIGPREILIYELRLDSIIGEIGS